MKFQELKDRAALKKSARLAVIGASPKDQAALDEWKKAGWQVRDESSFEAAVAIASKKETDLLCIFGTEPVKTIRAMEKLLPRENPPLVWLHGIEVPAYSKLLWAGCAPSAKYDNIPEALKVVQTMIRTLNTLGEAEPKAALLSCVEAISPGVPSTIWEAVLGHMGARGQFGKAKVDGPLALDLAVSPHACEEKKFKSDIGGQADLIVPPDLNSFLSLGTVLALSGEQQAADLVIGAPCPIIFAAPGEKDHADLGLAAASLLI